MVVQQTGNDFELNHNRVCAATDVSHFLLLAKPPSWPGGACRYLRPFSLCSAIFRLSVFRCTPSTSAALL